jgi:hypothetical protein
MPVSRFWYPSQMRIALVLVALAACAHARSPACPPPVMHAAPAPATPVTPVTKEDIGKRSREVLDAYDKGDVAVVERALSPGFIHFEGGKPSTRDDELGALKRRKPGGPFIAKREWSDERIEVHADHALFIGKATEVQGGNDSHGGGYRYVGWYTLHWGREGDAWKLRLWTWQRSGAVSQRETWNEIYRNDVGFEKQPNRLLVEITKGVRPGTALDLAMGQGRNGLYLASIGWKVTGIDFADEGLKVARDEAAKRKLELSTVNADIDGWDFGKARWDLVAMIYPGDKKLAWIEKAKVGLKPGGLFVYEYFAGDDTDDGGFKPGELAKLFADGFTIVRDDTVEDRPDWAMDRAKLVRFVARKNR